jgi:hypothetical protein
MLAAPTSPNYPTSGSKENVRKQPCPMGKSNKQHVKKHGFIIRAAPEKNRKGCRKVGNASNVK